MLENDMQVRFYYFMSYFYLISKSTDRNQFKDGDIHRNVDIMFILTTMSYIKKCILQWFLKLFEVWRE